MTANLPEAQLAHKSNLKGFCGCLVKNLYSMWMGVEKVGIN